jgi:DNA-binding transcriptional LysR family regulator
MFRAVMENRSVTRAAEALQVSQPAVSAQVAKLESQLGFRLFERAGRGLRPTAEGEFLYGEVARVLDQLNALSQKAADLRQAHSGKLTILSNPWAATTLLPPLVAGFLKERPDVSVRIISQTSETLRDLIRSQAFDLAIVEPPVSGPAVTASRYHMRTVTVVPPGHALSSRRELTPRALSGMPFITVFREHEVYHAVSRAFDAAGAKWNVRAEVQFGSTACAMAAAGAGVALVDPLSAADVANRGASVAAFTPPIYYDVAVVRPAERDLSILARHFIADIDARLGHYRIR